MSQPDAGLVACGDGGGGVALSDGDSRPAKVLPVVSVIVPAFNAAEFISDTLRSALSQNFAPFEVVVVDDGSTDRTPDILAKFAARDPRVRVFRQQNAGVAAARNRAIAEARGRYVAPLDADDLWHPDFLRLTVDALERAGPATAVAYTWFVKVDDSGAFEALALDTGRRPSLTRRDQVVPAMLLGNFIGNASSTVMRRDAVLAADGYDPSLRARGAEGCEDTKLYTLIGTRYDFAVVPRLLVGYRRHAAGMSRSTHRMLRSRLLTYQDVRKACPDMPVVWLRAAERRNIHKASGTFLRHCWDGRFDDAAEMLNEVLHIRSRPPFLSLRLGRPSDLLAGFCRAAWRGLVSRLRRDRRQVIGPPERLPFSALVAYIGPGDNSHATVALPCFSQGSRFSGGKGA